jgi:adenine phosphoribosyltransferase
LEPDTVDRAKSLIRDIPDFPKPGIIFKDITPVLQDAQAFGSIIDALADHYAGSHVDTIVGIESRGFILGAALAYRMKKGFSVVRKLGKLPWDTVKESYDLEYGTDTLEMHRDGVEEGQNVLIVDDLLATGGTASATVALVKKLGANVAGAAFAVELAFLSGRERLPGVDVMSLIQY